MNNEYPKLEWQNISGKLCLKFIFKGALDEQRAIEAIEKWKQEFEAKQGQKIVLVWDALEMEGYDNKSRVLWQHALKELKGQIDTIWLISESNLIKMGASIMSLFSSLQIKTISSEDEIRME